MTTSLELFRRFAASLPEEYMTSEFDDYPANKDAGRKKFTRIIIKRPQCVPFVFEFNDGVLDYIEAGVRTDTHIFQYKMDGDLKI